MTQNEQTGATRKSVRATLAAFISILLLSASFPSGAQTPIEHEYAQAVQSFRAGRTSEAYGQFIELANRGDVDAARVALFMNGYGASLYGKHWDALPSEVAYWSTLVRNSSMAAGRQQPDFQPVVVHTVKPRVRHASAVSPAVQLKDVVSRTE